MEYRAKGDFLFFSILRTLFASVTYSFEFLILQVVTVLSTSLFNDWLNKMHSAKRVPISLWEKTKMRFLLRDWGWASSKLQFIIKLSLILNANVTELRNSL